MIPRMIALVSSTALAYVMLRGWPEPLPGMMRACLAVLALVAGLGFWAKRPAGGGNRARGRRLPHWMDYTAIATAVLAAECGFLWLLGAAPGRLESVALVIERQFRPEAAALRAVADNGQSARPGNWLWTAETKRPLPKRTDFKPGVKPEVFVRLRDPADAAGLLGGKVYVRSFALGRYENTAWSPGGEGRMELKADAEGFVRLAPAARTGGIAHEVFHSADPDGQNAFTALQGAVLAGVSPLTRVSDGLHLLPPPDSPGGYQYTAVSAPSRIEDLPDHELVRPWPGADGWLLEGPEEPEFAARLRDLARSSAGTGTLKQQLLGLQRQLRDSFTYSLSSTNPRDLDPIENFLFYEKRGHCEYFATAGALMARALGIPSRVAYGWAGGKWYESAGFFVFRANEAHAWTEVWLDGHGWVIMDPTPQASGNGDRAQVAAPGEQPPGAGPDADPLTENPESAENPDFTRLALVLTLGFAIPAVLLMVMRSRREIREPGGSSAGTPPAAGAAPDYLKLWHQACAARGHATPPGCTLRRQIAGLADPPDFAGTLLAYHYATRYEGGPADAALEKRLVRLIREWQVAFSGINPASGPSHPRP